MKYKSCQRAKSRKSRSKTSSRKDHDKIFKVVCHKVRPQNEFEFLKSVIATSKVIFGFRRLLFLCKLVAIFESKLQKLNTDGAFKQFRKFLRRQCCKGLRDMAEKGLSFVRQMEGHKKVLINSLPQSLTFK